MVDLADTITATYDMNRALARAARGLPPSSNTQDARIDLAAEELRKKYPNASPYKIDLGALVLRLQSQVADSARAEQKLNNQFLNLDKKLAHREAGYKTGSTAFNLNMRGTASMALSNLRKINQMSREYLAKNNRGILGEIRARVMAGQDARGLLQQLAEIAKIQKWPVRKLVKQVMRQQTGGVRRVARRAFRKITRGPVLSVNYRQKPFIRYVSKIKTPVVNYRRGRAFISVRHPSLKSLYGQVAQKLVQTSQQIEDLNDLDEPEAKAESQQLRQELHRLSELVSRVFGPQPALARSLLSTTSHLARTLADSEHEAPEPVVVMPPIGQARDLIEGVYNDGPIKGNPLAPVGISNSQIRKIAQKARDTALRMLGLGKAAVQSVAQGAKTVYKRTKKYLKKKRFNKLFKRESLPSGVPNYLRTFKSDDDMLNWSRNTYPLSWKVIKAIGGKKALQRKIAKLRKASHQRPLLRQITEMAVRSAWAPNDQEGLAVAHRLADKHLAVDKVMRKVFGRDWRTPKKWNNPSLNVPDYYEGLKQIFDAVYARDRRGVGSNIIAYAVAKTLNGHASVYPGMAADRLQFSLACKNMNMAPQDLTRIIAKSLPRLVKPVNQRQMTEPVKAVLSAMDQAVMAAVVRGSSTAGPKESRWAFVRALVKSLWLSRAKSLRRQPKELSAVAETIIGRYAGGQNPNKFRATLLSALRKWMTKAQVKATLLRAAAKKKGASLKKFIKGLKRGKINKKLGKKLSKKLSKKLRRKLSKIMKSMKPASRAARKIARKVAKAFNKMSPSKPMFCSKSLLQEETTHVVQELNELGHNDNALSQLMIDSVEGRRAASLLAGFKHVEHRAVREVMETEQFNDAAVVLEELSEEASQPSVQALLETIPDGNKVVKLRDAIKSAVGKAANRLGKALKKLARAGKNKARKLSKRSKRAARAFKKAMRKAVRKAAKLGKAGAAKVMKVIRRAVDIVKNKKLMQRLKGTSLGAFAKKMRNKIMGKKGLLKKFRKCTEREVGDWLDRIHTFTRENAKSLARTPAGRQLLSILNRYRLNPSAFALTSSKSKKILKRIKESGGDVMYPMMRARVAMILMDKQARLMKVLKKVYGPGYDRTKLANRIRNLSKNIQPMLTDSTVMAAIKMLKSGGIRIPDVRPKKVKIPPKVKINANEMRIAMAVSKALNIPVGTILRNAGEVVTAARKTRKNLIRMGHSRENFPELQSNLNAHARAGHYLVRQNRRMLNIMKRLYGKNWKQHPLAMAWSNSIQKAMSTVDPSILNSLKAALSSSKLGGKVAARAAKKLLKNPEALRNLLHNNAVMRGVERGSHVVSRLFGIDQGVLLRATRKRARKMGIALPTDVLKKIKAQKNLKDLPKKLSGLVGKAVQRSLEKLRKMGIKVKPLEAKRLTQESIKTMKKRLTSKLKNLGQAMQVPAFRKLVDRLKQGQKISGKALRKTLQALKGTKAYGLAKGMFGKKADSSPARPTFKIPKLASAKLQKAQKRASALREKARAAAAAARQGAAANKEASDQQWQKMRQDLDSKIAELRAKLG